MQQFVYIILFSIIFIFLIYYLYITLYTVTTFVQSQECIALKHGLHISRSYKNAKCIALTSLYQLLMPIPNTWKLQCLGRAKGYVL
jgi:hypothetical protein